MSDELKELNSLLKDAIEWMDHICPSCEGSDVQKSRLTLAESKVKLLRERASLEESVSAADIKIMRRQEQLRRDLPATDRG